VPLPYEQSGCVHPADSENFHLILYVTRRFYSCYNGNNRLTPYFMSFFIRRSLPTFCFIKNTAQLHAHVRFIVSGPIKLCLSAILLADLSPNYTAYVPRTLDVRVT
jgi:hypothetical protein